MEQISAARYGKALFEEGAQNGKTQIFLEQLNDVSQIISQNEKLMEILTHPAIRSEEKRKIVSDIFENKVEQEILKLLWLLIEHGRMNEIRTIYGEYKKFVYEYKGIKIAFVKTAVPMTEDEKNLLREKLSKKYNNEIEIDQQIDPSIIGGVFLKVDDEVVDGTVRGRLESMKKELFEAR